MLACLKAESKAYQRGEWLLLAGDKPDSLGIILSGQVQIIQDDIDGNRVLVAALETGDLFAESLCCAGIMESPVSVFASSDCTILWIAFSKILHTCSNACCFHTQLIQNMLSLLAQKNLYLQSRMDVISSRTIREKVLKYLTPFAQKQGEAFRIPLSREQMADYLCVDRSALSHELIRLKKDGVLDYQKNTFQLMQTD